MKLNCIYLLIGISTLALNAALTFHILRKNTAVEDKKLADNEVITFRLSGKSVTDGATTAAIPYEDTLPLE